jgi:hypothetical protein
MGRLDRAVLDRAARVAPGRQAVSVRACVAAIVRRNLAVAGRIALGRKRGVRNADLGSVFAGGRRWRKIGAVPDSQTDDGVIGPFGPVGPTVGGAGHRRQGESCNGGEEKRHQDWEKTPLHDSQCSESSR